MILKAGNFMLALTASYSFEQKKEPTMVAKPPEKVQWKNERTCPTYFTFLVGNAPNTAKLRVVSCFKPPRSAVWL